MLKEAVRQYPNTTQLIPEQTRQAIAGSAYTPEEAAFIQSVILNPDLLSEHISWPHLHQLTKAELLLQEATVNEDNLRTLLDQRETISHHYRVVPLSAQPVESIAVGVKGRDATRLQLSFTDNQKEHGMTGSSTHPGLDAKIGTWFTIPAIESEVERLQTFSDVLPHAFFGSHPLFQPRSWVLDPSTNQIWLAADTGIHRFSMDGLHTVITSAQFEAPHDVSLTNDHAVFVCSSLDTVTLVNKKTQEVDDIIHLADFGYTSSIGKMELDGTETRLRYYYDDQQRPRAQAGEVIIKEYRDLPVGVPTALQRLHPNAVLCRNDHSMLVSFFNSVELDDSGKVDREKSGGKVVHISTEEFIDMDLHQFIELYGLRGFAVSQIGEGYTLTQPNTTVHEVAYLKNASNPKERMVIKRVEQNGKKKIQVRILNELVTGLHNPHGLVYVGEVDGLELYGVSDTNTGIFKIFSLTEKKEAEVVYELQFDDATEVPKLEGRTGHWIHHPRLMKHERELFLSVYDGKRSGIWIVGITNKTYSFVPMPEDAVVYQTQVYPKKTTPVT